MTLSGVAMEPVWRHMTAAGPPKWKCPQCPWYSVSFEEVENHIEDTHCRCGLDSNHWPGEMG